MDNKQQTNKQTNKQDKQSKQSKQETSKKQAWDKGQYYGRTTDWPMKPYKPTEKLSVAKQKKRKGAHRA